MAARRLSSTIAASALLGAGAALYLHTQRLRRALTAERAARRLESTAHTRDYTAVMQRLTAAITDQQPAGPPTAKGPYS
ncbi:hypothetical protein ABZ694_25115 [Streptomyces albidoflavus]|uniref:hypothetical protein n=1 Tax=Streptomyces albidoflavus TaxID=1886 RepID=UPI0033E530FF